MIASNVSKETLEAAAAEVGVRAEIDATSASGRRFRVKLYPVPPKEAYTAGGRRRKGEKGDARWQRTSASAFSDDRRVNAVCWHGFRAFFRAVYRREPEAVFRTAAATYKGSEHFERVHGATAHHNIGSQFRPVSMGEACRCEDTGYPSEPRHATVTILKQKDLLACPHCIIMPEHYRPDGRCRCDDAQHLTMSEWGYSWDGARWA